MQCAYRVNMSFRYIINKVSLWFRNLQLEILYLYITNKRDPNTLHIIFQKNLLSLAINKKVIKKGT